MQPHHGFHVESAHAIFVTLPIVLLPSLFPKPRESSLKVNTALQQESGFGEILFSRVFLLTTLWPTKELVGED